MFYMYCQMILNLMKNYAFTWTVLVNTTDIQNEYFGLFPNGFRKLSKTDKEKENVIC